jgi:hypothetical protein
MMRCVILIVASLVLEFALATPAQADKGVHVVGTTSDGGFWHTIANSDGRTLPFEDVLQHTGTPWTSHFPDNPFRAAIADIAVQPVGHNNDLLVLVLIEYHCIPPLLLEEGINPCLRRQAPPEAQTQVWQTFRNSSGQWGRFVNVTAQLGGLAFTRIGLARVSFALIYFCGATEQGDVALFNINTYQGLMWQNPRTLKLEAQFDPGPVTAVSCTDNKFSATLSVAMIANGNVFSTFLSFDGSNRAYKDQSFSEIGMDNLTARIGIPESVEDVDVAATYGYRELHLIVGAPGRQG